MRRGQRLLNWQALGNSGAGDREPAAYVDRANVRQENVIHIQKLVPSYETRLL
jgi:hypothetical protein